MTNITAYRNEDIPLTLTLGDLEYVINDYDNIIVYFYHKFSKVIVTKFSINVIAGYEDIVVTDSANKIIDIIVPDADTLDAMTGLYQLSYRAEYTDAGFPDGVDDDIGVLDTEVNLISNPLEAES